MTRGAAMAGVGHHQHHHQHHRIRRQLTPTSLFLGLLLGLAFPGSIGAFRVLMRGRIAPANVRRFNGGPCFFTARGGAPPPSSAAAARHEGERGGQGGFASSSPLTRTKATTVVSGAESMAPKTTTGAAAAANPSATSSLLSAMMREGQEKEDKRGAITEQQHQKDEQGGQIPPRSEEGEARGERSSHPQDEREATRGRSSRGAVGDAATAADDEDDDDSESVGSAARSEADEDEEEHDELMLTDEDLETIVAQRGSELSRMNGALSHLSLAHTIWGQALRPGGTVIDATCGNGHDSLMLARYLFPTGVSDEKGTWGRLHCVDIQPAAIDSTRRKLLTNSGSPLEGVSESVLDRYVSFHVCNFCELPREIKAESVSLIVYNLGYLPGSRDKHITTTTRDTLDSLRQVLFQRGPLLAVHGLVSIMCYRGHAEGAKETAAVMDFVEGLDPMTWRCFAHAPLNRPLSPLLITIYRLK